MNNTPSAWNDTVGSMPYAEPMATAAEREAFLRRVRYAADAAYSEGITEQEILAAVHAGVANARAVAALFDNDGDGIADYAQRAA